MRATRRVLRGAATIAQVKEAVDAAARRSGFRCVPVSWEDCARWGAGGGGALSCVGPNISDVRLFEKGEQTLFTLRSDNWNERLGYVAARDVALVTGNERPVASALTPTTLQDYLANVGELAAYAGVKTPSLAAPGATDEVFGIRFQTVFLPVGGGNHLSASPPTTEFCTEVYNYQTRSEDDPRNLLLLATPQGVSAQTDAPGRARLYFHSVDGAGTVHRYWLEAEKSEQKVGGEQKEAQEEALAAARRGKATAVRLGPAAMGTRFNVQMLIQVPVVQANPPQDFFCDDIDGLEGDCDDEDDELCYDHPEGVEGACSSEDESDAADDVLCAVARRSDAAAAPRIGTSNAARVSRGSEQDTWAGVKKPFLKRDASQHGTITVTMYYTVVGGVPSVADVERAVEDLDALYKAMPSDKRLTHCDEVLAKPPGATTGPSETCFAHCPAGHQLVGCHGDGKSGGGWWCDGCGVFVPLQPPPLAAAPPTAGAARTFACRQCDFDLCRACANGPRCAAGHALTPLRLKKKADAKSDAPAGVATCTECSSAFTLDVANLFGCSCASGRCVLCTACYCARRAKHS